MEKLKGFIVCAGHEAQVFKDCLNRMEENICRCGRTPSEVGEEFFSSEDKARTELSYASALGSNYVAPPIKNPIPIPVPAPCQHAKFLTLIFSPFFPSDRKSPCNLSPTPHPLYISFIPQLNSKPWHYYVLSPSFHFS